VVASAVFLISSGHRNARTITYLRILGQRFPHYALMRTAADQLGSNDRTLGWPSGPGIELRHHWEP
jgi:hypothetical protein